jgi:hypothetical protein
MVLLTVLRIKDLAGAREGRSKARRPCATRGGGYPPSFCKSGAIKDLREKGAVRVVQQRTYELFDDK